MSILCYIEPYIPLQVRILIRTAANIAVDHKPIRVIAFTAKSFESAINTVNGQQLSMALSLLLNHARH